MDVQEQSQTAVKEELQRRAVRLMAMKAKGEDAMRKATVWNKLRMNCEMARSIRGRAKLEAEIKEQSRKLEDGAANQGLLEQQLAQARERGNKMMEEKDRTVELLQRERQLVAALKDGHATLAKLLEDAQKEAEAFRQDAVDREAELESVRSEKDALRATAELKEQEVQTTKAKGKAARVKEVHNRAVELLAARLKEQASVRRALAFAKLRQFSASRSAKLRYDKVSFERESIKQKNIMLVTA